MQKSKKFSIYGVGWFILSLLIDNINDVVMKYVGHNMHAYQVVCLRFLFMTLTLVPFVFYNKSMCATSLMRVHFLRGLLLFGAIVLWCKGLGVVKITVATSINFTIPIFILILANIFLKEEFNWIRVLSTITGFIGAIIVMNTTSADFELSSILLIVGAFMFALLDVINKRIIAQETTLNMLFYSGVFVFLFSIIPAIYVWTTPTYLDLILAFVLGITGNLILYCLLKSFALIEISSVAPYRYIEIIFSAVLGYIVFAEVPHVTTVIGASIIMASTSLLIYETVFLKFIHRKARVKHCKQNS